MDGTKSISFVIPCRNAANTITRCLGSIRDLDYPGEKVEIIIADNGSHDRTPDIGRKYTDKVFSDKTATIAGLRNLGAEKAQGEFIVFVDSDCLIPRNWAKEALAYFEDAEAGTVGSRMFSLSLDATWIERTWKMHLERKRHKREVSWLSSRAIMVKKDVFTEIGGFDESLTTCEDVDFGYRVREKYKIISDEKLAPVHMGGEKSLLEFFKKESWRGKDSLKVGQKYPKEWKESLNIAVLSYYLTMLALLLPALGVTVITKNIVYVSSMLAGILLPVVFISFDTCRKTKQYRNLGRMFILYFTYIMARVGALFG